MSGYFTKNDVYDKNGVLLLSKGQKMTDETITRLRRHGDYKQEELVDFNSRQSVILTPVAKELGVRMNIRDDRLLEQPNKILSTIIFESKTKPWWIYVNALSNYVDWLYTHSIDVAMISLMMAVELGYSGEELFNIGLSALLHDVGKLLVPKSIIQKPGNLTGMETSCIRQHCELGMSSLEGFDFPKEYADIIMQHHERLDGSGYPKGLKGEEICHNARIVMIADVVDAITSFRPYRQPRNMDAAIRELRNGKEKYPQELIYLLEKILE
ncbi:HD domain-containing phosphohydrolase [Desulfoscipio sp. XC116]|uniref:HD-GYP domain-containing protein n=1 Tax=Desulfoscipio sp. XC116 TaxID=3144975 RepID=UPI00325AE0F1